MQVKATLRFQLNLVRMPKMKRTNEENTGKGNFFHSLLVRLQILTYLVQILTCGTLKKLRNKSGSGQEAEIGRSLRVLGQPGLTE